MTSKVCQLGVVSAGTTCDLLMLHLVRKRQRARLIQATMQQQPQPDSVKNTSWGDRLVTLAANKLPPQVAQRLHQLPHTVLVMILIAFVGLGFVSRDVRLSGTNRRRKQKLDKKNIWKEKLVPIKHMELDEPDAEPKGSSWWRSIPDANPKGRNWWTSIPGNYLRRTTSDVNGTSSKSSDPVVPMKALMPKHPVASTDDEPEDEDRTGSYRCAAPGSCGFVAQQTADVERVLQIFRMNTEGQVHLVDEEGLEQQKLESQVVPNGLVRSCTVGLECKIEQKPLRSRSKA